MSCLHSFKVWREREKRTFRSSSIDWGKNSRALFFCKISIQIQVFTDFFFFFLLEFSLMFSLLDYWYLLLFLLNRGHNDRIFEENLFLLTRSLRTMMIEFGLVWFGDFSNWLLSFFLMSGKTKRRLIIAWKTAIIWQVMRQNEKQTKTPEKQVN